VGLMWYLYLSEPPHSHFETAALVMPRWFAVSSWVSPLSERRRASVSLILVSISVPCSRDTSIIRMA